MLVPSEYLKYKVGSRYSLMSDPLSVSDLSQIYNRQHENISLNCTANTVFYREFLSISVNEMVLFLYLVLN